MDDYYKVIFLLLLLFHPSAKHEPLSRVTNTKTDTSKMQAGSRPRVSVILYRAVWRPFRIVDIESSSETLQARKKKDNKQQECSQ